MGETINLNLNKKKKAAYGNQVAVIDSDYDGKNELLIRIGGTCNADFADYLYKYDEQTKTFIKIFDYYAGISFYSNGFIWTRVSHSQYMDVSEYIKWSDELLGEEILFEWYYISD